MTVVRLLPLVPAAALLVRSSLRRTSRLRPVAVRARTHDETEGRAGTRSIRAVASRRRRRRASTPEV